MQTKGDIEIRRAGDRGSFENYWLNSRFSFSFADYYDQAHVSFGPLRVLNEDWVRPGTGFDPHPHRDMEIITVVLDGTVEHTDSTGAEGRTSAGEVQVMTAGTGVIHSEKNPSDNETLHLFQIWIMPDRRGLKPRYDQARFTGTTPVGRSGELVTLVSGRVAAPGSPGTFPLFIHQDAELLLARFEAGQSVVRPIEEGRRAYVHVIEGEARIGGRTVSGGDAVKWTPQDGGESAAGIRIEAITPARVLFIDLP